MGQKFTAGSVSAMGKESEQRPHLGYHLISAVEVATVFLVLEIFTRRTMVSCALCVYVSSTRLLDDNIPFSFVTCLVEQLPQ